MYSRTNPFLATIVERYCLSHPGTKKNTQHLVLSLKGSGMTYQVGDSFGVFPLNDPQLVEQTLSVIKASGEELIVDKMGVTWSLRDFFTSQANLTEVSRKFILEISHRQTGSAKKAFLEMLHQPENKEKLKEYLSIHQVWDFLSEHEEVFFSPQELSGLLMPLLPRLYSIASSQKVVGEEVHLIIAYLEFETNGHRRKGVCTHYLCNLASIGVPSLPVYIQPHHGFTLPEDSDASIIMIGPGTGVAPYRAFMQERDVQGAQGKNWLFFGEWNRQTDFFYETFWEEMRNKEKLRLSLAFSRDQPEKVYVQHRMLEEGKELFQWISEGAYIFVCGDMHHMARDVEAALLQIFEQQGNMSPQAAKDYLKKLRTDKRYRRDVY